RSLVDLADAVRLQPVPERGHGFQDLAAALEEPGPVEVGVEVDLLQLLHCVAGVLALDAVVPGEERQTQARNARLLDLQQAVFQLLPEAGRGPVLDREAGPLGNARVLAAVEPL